MQQVSYRTATSPIVIDPRRSPLPQRRRQLRALGHINRYWVLHRVLVLRAIAGLACALVLATGFQVRGGIGEVMSAMSNALQGEFAQAGFAVDEISITGQVLTRESDIISILELDAHSSTLNFDVDAARTRLLSMPAVAEASVRRIYPGRVLVTLVEKQPVARWNVDGVTFLIDATGSQIGDAQPADAQLPLVIGDGAADDAQVIIRALKLYPELGGGLAALSRIADRRWDMIYENGLRVKLPETGIAQALRMLDSYQKDYQLLERDLMQVDLRVAGTLTVRHAGHQSLLNTIAS